MVTQRMKSKKEECQVCKERGIYSAMMAEEIKTLKERLESAETAVKLIVQRHILARKHNEYECIDANSDDVPF